MFLMRCHLQHHGNSVSKRSWLSTGKSWCLIHRLVVYTEVIRATLDGKPFIYLKLQFRNLDTYIEGIGTDLRGVIYSPIVRQDLKPYCL